MPDLRPYRTDLESNIFTDFRQAQGIVYVDALLSGKEVDEKTLAPRSPDEGLDKEASRFLGGEAPQVPCPTLFWPGCSLASYSSELTRASYRFLYERGLVNGLTAACCGDILRYSASKAECQAYVFALVVQLEAQGVQKIIAGCPTCYYSLRNLLEQRGVELVALPEILAEAGTRITLEMIAPATCVCIHDPCPDRRQGVFAASVRSLFAKDIRLVEKRHHGMYSRCCGLGKLAFVRHPERSERRRQSVLEEFTDTGADLLATSCASCVSAFQTLGEESAQSAAPDSCAHHYLEFLFPSPGDHYATLLSSD